MAAVLLPSVLAAPAPGAVLTHFELSTQLRVQQPEQIADILPVIEISHVSKNIFRLCPACPFILQLLPCGYFSPRILLAWS